MKKIAQQFFKYALVGLLNTGITLGLIYALIVWYSFYHVLANFIGYAAGFAFSFFFNRRLTFRSQGNWRRELTRFLIVFGISYAMSLVSLLALHRLQKFPYVITTALSIGVYTVASFALNRRFVFTKAQDSLAPPDKSI